MLKPAKVKVSEQSIENLIGHKAHEASHKERKGLLRNDA